MICWSFPRSPRIWGKCHTCNILHLSSRSTGDGNTGKVLTLQTTGNLMTETTRTYKMDPPRNTPAMKVASVYWPDYSPWMMQDASTAASLARIATTRSLQLSTSWELSLKVWKLRFYFLLEPKVKRLIHLNKRTCDYIISIILWQSRVTWENSYPRLIYLGVKVACADVVRLPPPETLSFSTPHFFHVGFTPSHFRPEVTLKSKSLTNK